MANISTARMLFPETLDARTSSESPERCSHGTRDGCADCLIDELKELMQVLDEPDCREVLEDNIFTSLKCFGRKTLGDLEKMLSTIPTGVPDLDLPVPRRVRDASVMSQETAVPATATHGDGSAYDSVDEEPPFLSPREAPSPSRTQIHPTVVRGSAFGAARQSIESNLSYAEFFASKPRAAWTKEQTDELIEAQGRYRNQWESIRRHYPNLRQYTGLQLKDKWRHLAK